MVKSERGFRYQKRDKDAVKERANARGGNFDSFIKSKYKLYKVKDGKNLVRILPPTWEKARHYGYDIWVNYGIGVDNQSYLSLSKMNNEKDPLLEARREAEREGDKKAAQALQARQRILMWVIDRLDEDEGPQLWAAAFTVDKDVANLCFDEDTKEVVYIDDPETGCDLRFYKEGQGLLTKYPPSKMKLLKGAPIHEDEGIQKEWLEFVTENPVPETLQFYDYEHISATFGGQVRKDPDDDDEDEEKPKRRQSARDRDDDEDADEEQARKRKRAARGDDDDDPPPKKRRAAADDDEDEEKPAKRARSKLKSRDDDEDEAADDEDEDERPTKSRRGATSRASDDDDEDEEPAPKKGGSIRERLAARRGSKADEDADDD